jgi:tetratricopeptide (TPR) repeat protein
MVMVYFLYALMILAAPVQDDEMPDAWKSKLEAAVRAESSGKFAQEEALLTEVVSEAEKLGQNDLRLAKPLELLAIFQMDKKRGRFAEAEPLLRRALRIREAAQGAEHLDVAGTLAELAMCQIAAEKHDDTTGLMLRRALRIVEKTKGPGDPDTANIIHVLSIWHMQRKDYDAAGSELSRALAIREKAFGLESIKVADVLDDQGDLHAVQVDTPGISLILETPGGIPPLDADSEKHAKQAEALYRRALAIREKLLKPDDALIAESLYNLGQLAADRHRQAEVELYLNRWLHLHDKLNKSASARLGKVLFLLAEAAVDRHDFMQAEHRLTRAQRVFDELSGAESDEVSSARRQRAEIAITTGRFDHADALLKQGLLVQATLIGEDNPDVKQAQALMASRYQDHANDRLAYVLWHQLDVLAKQTDKHDALAAILRTYADLLRRTNRVVPLPTEDDLAYLKKVGAVLFPTSLANLMKYGLLMESSLDDQGLAHISRFYGLEQLRLSQDVSDAGLAHLKSLTLLRDLELMNTKITDAGLVHLTGLKGLEKLNLASTRVGDNGLAALKDLTKLRELNLTYTNVTDRGLEQLKSLKSLTSLNLTSTRITQAEIDRLRRERPGLRIQYEPGNGFVVPTAPAGALGIIPTVPARP